MREEQLKKRMEELKNFHDQSIIIQASKKAKKLKGKSRKDEETDKETSSKKTPPAKKLKETLLSNDELDDLTDIEWPEEYQTNKEDTELDYNLIGHRIDKDGKPQFFLRFTWEEDKDSSDWYPASNAFKDYPHLTATFMMQMKLNKNKDWESFWKKVDKKLRINCPRQEYVKEGGLQCKYSHGKIALNFSPETNPAYWGSNGDIHGVKCNQCKKDIVKECKPSSNKPVHCCKGRTKYFCKICFCDPCYKKLLLKDDEPKARKGTRKRNRTSS